MQRGGGRAPSGRGARIEPPTPAAIVAAGGLGRRAARDEPVEAKQFRALRGRPLYEWSLPVLAAAGCDPIVVAVPERYRAGLRPPADLSVVVRFVTGGESRQASVRNGLDHIQSEVVVIHDAARPFVSIELVRRVVIALDAADGAVAAVPLGDTLKRVDDCDAVVETVDRAGLWRSQTPAAFRTAALKAAHERAAADRFIATDDAHLVERDGGTVVVVYGSETNIKVTWPEDLAIAEALAGTLP